MARPLEPEIKAMRQILTAMKPLSSVEKHRIKTWLGVPDDIPPAVMTRLGEPDAERYRMALEAVTLSETFASAKDIAARAIEVP